MMDDAPVRQRPFLPLERATSGMQRLAGGLRIGLAMLAASPSACRHDAYVPGRACAAGEERACYSGPEATEGVGACRAGTQTCTEDESGWGPCEDEITPVPESCATPADDDCDGETNEEG